jgi:hypothetical protein
MALSFAQVGHMMKTQYLPVVLDIIKLEDYIQRYIDKFEKFEDVNYEFEKGYRYSFSEGTKMMTDFTGKIANPADSIYKKVRGKVKWRTGSIKIYKAIAKLMNKDKKAFVNDLKNEVKGISESMKAEACRMAYGDGGKTEIAKCATAANAGTVDGITSVLVTLADGATNKFLRPGMPLDFHDPATKAVVENGEEIYITNMVGRGQFTFKTKLTGSTLTALISALAGTLIYHHGGYLNETEGLKSLIGDHTNTILGQNRNTADGDWFKPQVFRMADSELTDGGSSGTLSDWDLLDVEQVIQMLTMRNGADINELRIFTTPGIEKYAVTLYRQFGEANPAREKVDLWPYKTISIGAVPMLTSYPMFDNTMYIPDMSGFVRFNAMELHFDEDDGHMWKWVAGYAAYTAYLMEAYELGHWTPWRCAAIYDLKTKYKI